MEAWLDYFGGVVMGLVALLFLFEGSRRLAAHGVRKDAVQLVVAGVFFSLLNGGSAYFKHRLTEDVIQAVKQPIFSKYVPLSDDWGASCCKNTREAESRKMVQAAFVESGQLHSFLDAAGKRLPFIPSEKDMKEREERVVSNARLEDASRARFSEAVYALIAAVLAALFGAGVGQDQRRKASANNTSEPDSRNNGARGSP